MAAQLPADCYVASKPLAGGDMTWIPAASAALLSSGGAPAPPYNWQSIPKSVRGFYVWDPVGGRGADYDKYTSFTAVNCDNDGTGFNQCTSDMVANGITKLYCMPGVATSTITPSIGTSAFQLQPNWEYNIEGWTSIRAQNATSQICMFQVASGFGGGSPGSYDVFGFVGTGSQTAATQYVKLENLTFYDNSISVRHVANLTNPGLGTYETSSRFECIRCWFQGEYAQGWSSTVPAHLGGALVMDYNEDSILDRCGIRGNAQGSFQNGLSWLLVNNGNAVIRRTSVGNNYTQYGLGGYCFVFTDMCVLPNSGIVVVDLSNTANVNPTSKTVNYPREQFVFLGCTLNNPNANWFTNNQGIAAGAPRSVTVTMQGGTIGVNNYSIIGTPGGGPVQLVTSGVYYYSSTATGHLAVAGTPVIDSGSNSYANDVNSPLTDSLYPVFGNKIAECPPDTGRNQPGTSSTTNVATGLGSLGGFSFTPRVTGRMFIVIWGAAANSTGADGWSAQITYGSGTAPANGATSGLGTATGSAVTGSGSTKTPFICYSALVSGLTTGTAYWCDLLQKAVTGGTATLYAVQSMIFECQV